MKTWTQWERHGNDLVEVTYTSDMTPQEWAASPRGQAFMDRAQMRQDLRELNSVSSMDILRAVFEVGR